MVYRKKMPRRPRRRTTKGKFHGTKHSSLAVNSGQYARVVDSLKLADDRSNTPYSLTVKPSQFDRLVALFKVYRYYRIVEVEMELRPHNNMSLVNGVDLSGALANAFIMPNTSGLQPTYFNPAWLQSQGVRPILYNKSINRKWKPKTLIATNTTDTTTDAGFTAQSCLKWIPTQRGIGQINSDVEYYGMLYEYQTSSGTALPIGECFITVVCEFKEPFDVLPAPPGDNAVMTVYK